MGIGMVIIFIETLGSTFVNKCCQVHHSWHPCLFPSSTFLSIMFLDLNINNHYQYQICIMTITISSKALLSAPWILSNFVLFLKNINVGMAVTPWPAAVSWHWSTSTWNSINLKIKICVTFAWRRVVSSRIRFFHSQFTIKIFMKWISWWVVHCS